MKHRAVVLFAVLPLLVAGCANKEADALRTDIAKLEQELVETTVVEKARQEAVDAEAALEASRVALDEARAGFAKLEAERDATRAANDAEVARNAKLRGEIDAVARRAQQRAARGQELDAQIASVRERATFLRDQAAVLAREIRPGDVTWASKRRLDSLAEFAERIAVEYPDDPALADLAHAVVRVEVPVAGQVRAAGEQAARIRDRFTAVYELPSPEVTARETTAREDKP